MFRKIVSKASSPSLSTSASNVNDPNKKCSTNNFLTKKQILTELHQMYIEPNDGLLSIGEKMGLHLFAPRRKVNVMLIGNHSSGKSSFINWYVGAKVQKTGVAIETQGFTIVTSGQSRETLTGKATLRLYPYMKPLESINGVLPYLTTELTPSNSRHFNLVTFIDTPGLADGELHYPYDMEKAILWLGETADLIFVFFDPIGQALCKRMLNLVEKLNHYFPERIRFFLSKADEAGVESDRQKVMMQIVQELCKRDGLNQCGFEMSTIFIPGHTDLKVRDQMCDNQIEDACEDIEKTIALTIQNTFNTMESNIDQLEELAQSKVFSNKCKLQNNSRNFCKLLLMVVLCAQLPLSAVIFPSSSMAAPKVLIDLKEETFFDLPFVRQILLLYLYVLSFIRFFLPLHSSHLLLYSCLLSATILFISKFFIPFKSTLSGADYSETKRILSNLRNVYRPKREKLFSCYLNQMLHDVDID